MSKKATIENSAYGFRRLDPVPSQEELGEFYQSQYYDLIRKGGRAPELRRLLDGGDAGAREQQWLREGMHTDIVAVLAEHCRGKRLLEVGCGTGEFLSFAKENQFEVEGIEPSVEAAKIAIDRHLKVHPATLEQFTGLAPEKNPSRFDAVVLLNVLEHVPDPVNTVQLCRSLLNPDGILCVRVPNDFTPLQQAAELQTKKQSWWVAAPDHINYFNFKSLRRLFEGLGFDVAYQQGDFPMEMFLLMGDDYVGNHEVGKKCHERRVRFDLALPGELRRSIYQSFAAAGIGRDCLMFGRKH